MSQIQKTQFDNAILTTESALKLIFNFVSSRSRGTRSENKMPLHCDFLVLELQYFTSIWFPFCKILPALWPWKQGKIFLEHNLCWSSGGVAQRQDAQNISVLLYKLYKPFGKFLRCFIALIHANHHIPHIPNNTFLKHNCLYLHGASFVILITGDFLSFLPLILQLCSIMLQTFAYRSSRING